MSRNFESFIDAYLAYANDDFVPEKFNLWSALSIVAGSLERKVWLPWSDTFSYYPNIYVLLVAMPGVGKSTALNKAIGLLQEMDEAQHKLKLIPSQVTEAKFIEIMGHSSPFEIGTRIHQQSSGYYWASEASNSLRNIYGDFIACLTDFYDCPPYWEKATLKDDKITLRNIALNLIAGSTFDYLGKLVTSDNIMGGFASRLFYVVQREKLNRSQKFQLGAKTPEQLQARRVFRAKLIEDLARIHQMTGPFTADAEFGAAWEAWYPNFETRRQQIESERLQSLIVRTNGNALKLAMLFSAAESNDKILRLRHWQRAIDLVEEMNAEIPLIFREAQANSSAENQGGLNQAIFKYLASNGNAVPLTRLKRQVALISQAPPYKVDSTINYLIANKAIRTVGASGSDLTVQLAVNPDNYL